MSKEQSYQNAASELLRLVGGKENVISAAHCATRLRLVLKDESKADVDGILKTELVKGQFATGGQFQIIPADVGPDMALAHAVGLQRAVHHTHEHRFQVLFSMQTSKKVQKMK